MPLMDGEHPERDDEGSIAERAFQGHGQVLLSCPCGCGMAWLEPAEFYDDPDPADASWHRRDLGDTYWLAGFTVQ